MTTDLHILVAYDGPACADRALDRAALLFPGSRVTVVTAWWSVDDAVKAARLAMPGAMIRQAASEMDAAAESRAQDTAQAGVRRGQQAGLHAVARAACADPNIWSAIVHTATDLDVDAVVVGSRGHSTIRSVVLGTVSTALAQHCPRPLVLVR